MTIEWIAIFIPIFFSAVAWIIFKKKLVWLEIIAPTLFCLVLIAVLKWIMTENLTQDEEYLTEYVTKANYYEPWDEYIHRTCTVSCGKNCTRTVDCSYVAEHEEYWEIETNCGNTYKVSKEYYDYVVRQFGNKYFVEMDRDYYREDGDCYSTDYPDKFEKIIPLVFSENYENRTQATYTVFKFRELDSIEKKGLYDYPEIKDRNQQSCLGCTFKQNVLLNRYNALIGKEKQIRIFILVFKNKGISKSELQRVYWKNGNKNELVICMDSKLSWVNTFSWCDNKAIQVNTNEIFKRKDISFTDKIWMLDKEIEKNWKRKNFEDFSYIDVPLTMTQIIWLYILVSIFTIAILYFGVVNDVDQNSY